MPLIILLLVMVLLGAGLDRVWQWRQRRR